MGQSAWNPARTIRSWLSYRVSALATVRRSDHDLGGSSTEKPSSSHRRVLMYMTGIMVPIGRKWRLPGVPVGQSMAPSENATQLSSRNLRLATCSGIGSIRPPSQNSVSCEVCMCQRAGPWPAGTLTVSLVQYSPQDWFDTLMVTLGYIFMYSSAQPSSYS